MKHVIASLVIPMAAALTSGAAGVSAQQPAGNSARPRNPAANLPSDTGSQTTNPSGAVTGAGQPQGTTTQRDVGSPGGLERRARRDARATGGTAAAGAGAGAGSAGATDGGEGTSRTQRTRARRASKG